MEPMALGSPVSPQPTSYSSPYLPGFLIGDSNSLSSGPGSPKKTPRQVHFATNVTNNSMTQKVSPAPEFMPRIQSISTRNEKTSIEKTRGPPTVGLFDTLETTIVRTPQHNISSSPVITSDDKFQKINWVTVFGFPPSTASSIIGHFSKLGHVIDQVYTEFGNWVHLCYSSKMEAKRALSYNGRIIAENIMIGVVPLRDQIVLDDVTNQVPLLSTPKSTKSLSYVTNTPSSPYSEALSLKPRSLIGSASGENEVLAAQNVPSKNTSIVSKTMDYFFGW
uniref:Nucleoporin NUP35 n=1 Tax=Clastoptera arizonana TaxID=38151 RepID=A0A1B6DPH9_9HEMI